MHKAQRYFISREARDNLPRVLRAGKGLVTSDTTTISFDGNPIVTPGLNLSGETNISHTLSVLATYTQIDSWIDNRTPEQIEGCNVQLEPPPKFTSIRQAREYHKQNGYDTYRALWTPNTLVTKDDLGNPIFRHAVKLLLDQGTRSFYYRLATKHKMRLLTRNNAPSEAGYVSACLEAIGQEWLLPPETVTLQTIVNGFLTVTKITLYDLIHQHPDSNRGPKGHPQRVHIHNAVHEWQTKPLIDTSISYTAKTRSIYQKIWFLSPFLQFPDTIELAELLLSNPTWTYNKPILDPTLRIPPFRPQRTEAAYRDLVVEGFADLALTFKLEPQSAKGQPLTQRSYAAAALEAYVRGELVATPDKLKTKGSN